MKRTISAKIDESLWVHIKSKSNLSRYVEELIKQDIQMLQQKPIVKAVRDALLEDEEFFTALQDRLKGTTKDQFVEAQRREEVNSTPDWGA